MNSTIFARVAVRTLTAFAICAGLLGCSGDSPEKLVASAKTYIARHDRRAAVIQLKNALQKQPNLAEARFLLGKTLLDGEDAVAAQIELQKASDLKYPRDAVAPEMARALLALNRHKQLTDEYGAMALTAPAAVADLKTSVAAAYMAQHDPQRARAALHDAFEAEPDYLPALLLQARFALRNHDPDGARAALDKAFQKAPPNAADAWVVKGQLLASTGAWNDAIAAYKKALVLQPDNLAAHTALVAIYLGHGDSTLAQEQVAALKKLRPDHPQTLYLQAQTASQLGDTKTATRLVQQLLKAGDDPLTLQLAAGLAMRRGSPIEAEGFLTKAVQLSSDLPLARLQLAQLYVQRGEPTKALTTLEPLLEGGSDAEALGVAAAAYWQRGDTQKAEALFTQALRIKPDDRRFRAGLALLHLSGEHAMTGFDELESVAKSDPGITTDLALIDAHLLRKEYAPALQAVDRIDTRLPNKALPAKLRGRILLIKGDTAAARASFEQALARDATDLAATEMLAALDLREKGTAAAEQRIQKLLDAQPDNALALADLARLKERAGEKKDDIVALLNKAITASPTEQAPRLQLINYQLRQKDSQAALTTAQGAVAALPDSLELTEAFARALAATGNVNQAVVAYRKLALARPRAPEPYMGMADAYLATGAKEDAIRSLKRALELVPNYLPAQQKLIPLDIAGGHRDEAIAIAHDVQKQHPTWAVGWSFEADAQASASNWKAAEALYRTALEKEGAAGVAEKLNYCLLQEGQRAQAAAQADAWIKNHPQDVAFALYLGTQALIEKNIPEADRRFQQALKMKPDDPLAMISLAWTAGKLNRPEALELAQRANKMVPNRPSFMDTLAMVLAQRKGSDLQRAIEIQKQVVAMQPQTPEFRLSLARMYIDAGDKVMARQELDGLARLGSKFADQNEVSRLRAQL